MEEINARTLRSISISLLLTTALSQNMWPDDVSYEDLENLGASCGPSDTCANLTYGLDGSVERDFISNSDSCDCGIICIKYDTCCVDSFYRRYNTKYYRGSDSQACVKVHEKQFYRDEVNFFMVAECDPRWSGHPQIQNSCHNSDIRDPYSLVPAFDHKNNRTYKNFFCGICNGVELESLSLWTITMETTSFRNYSNEELAEDFTFNEESGSWGHWENFGDKSEFRPVTITINIPKNQYQKRCIKDLIQNCDPEWTDETILQKCLSYMAPVGAFPNGGAFRKMYRNVHCAICNNALYQNYYPHVCDRRDHTEGHGVSITGGGGVVPISFTLLFDVNPRDGVQVGKISKCKAGESYDPFFKKCRSLVCGIPGYVLQNNICVRY